MPDEEHEEPHLNLESTPLTPGLYRFRCGHLTATLVPQGTPIGPSGRPELPGYGKYCSWGCFWAHEPETAEAAAEELVRMLHERDERN